MAAGFISKALSTLAATTARWIEFADTSTAPVHGAVIVDPATGLPLDTSLATEIVGNVASATTDSGKPVKVAGVYGSSPPVLTTGQRGDLQLTSRGDLKVGITNSSGAFVDILSTGFVIAPFTPLRINTSTTTVVKASAGTLKRVTVNTKGTVASTVTIYNNTAGSGTIIAVIDSLTLTGTFEFDATMSTGITIVTTGAPDITVMYR